MASIVVNGDTSGAVTLSAPAVAGSTVLTLPSTSGTLLTTASGQWITTGSNIYYNTGSVGIGTTSPASPLQVNTAGVNTTVQINSTDANGGYGANLSLNNTGTGGRQYVIYSTSNADGDVGGGKFKITDATASATRMILDSNGRFQVSGATVVDSARISVSFDSANSTGVSYKALASAGGTVSTIWNSSNSTVGSITTTGSVTLFNTTSDYRLKNTITPMTGALAKVLQLKPVTYKWNRDGANGQGFIAHELQAVVPDCVTGEKDAVDSEGNPKYQQVDTSFLIATLTAAIQELKAELDTVKAELAALKG